MFTLISDQTDWYLNKANQLRVVSNKMNMQHQKGRHKEFMKIFNGLIQGEQRINFVIMLKRGVGGNVSSFEDKSKSIRILIKEIKEKIIENGYFDHAFKNGAVTPISKQINPYHCMHENKLHEYQFKQNNGYE